MAIAILSSVVLATTALLSSQVRADSSPSTALRDPVDQFPINIKPLGRIALTGNFDAVSVYQYQGQNATAAQEAAAGSSNKNNNNNNSSQSSQALSVPLPNGQILPTAFTNADNAQILAMCPLLKDDGSVKSVIVAGNFTHLRGIKSHGLALYDPASDQISAIDGLNGTVNALHCDSKNNSAVIGGDFTLDKKTASQKTKADSKTSNGHTNAAIWSEEYGLAPLPFDGFNGPVTSIAPTSNGTLVFGGAFSELGNSSYITPSHRDKSHHNSSSSTNSTANRPAAPQVVNLATADITTYATSTEKGFNDPRSIVCKGSDKSKDGPGQTWLTEDNTPGYWRADMGYSFKPTKLRLWNTGQDGRGTTTFAFRAQPNDGLSVLAYHDKNGTTAYCNPGCPLPPVSEQPYQDYTFPEGIRMTGFQLEVWQWSGKGGGFDGIELFTDEIVSYAVDEFNEPLGCGNTTASTVSKVSKQGDWVSVQRGPDSSSDYMKIVLGNDAKSASLRFQPDIKQSANYSVYMYTPGCSAAGSCPQRGQVNITLDLQSESRAEGDESESVSTSIWQTNNYEKYDLIYEGYVEAAGSGFRPAVILSPLDGARGQEVVASYVKFEKIGNTTRDDDDDDKHKHDGKSGADLEINGLFAYDPKKNAGVEFNKVNDTAIARAGAVLGDKSQVNAIINVDDHLIMAGKFASDAKDSKGKKLNIKNIFSINDKDDIEAFPDNGLDGQVNTMLVLDDLVYIGGKFSKTANGKQALRNVASYDPKEKKWSGVGDSQGFNGEVQSINEMVVSVASKSVSAVAFTGDFTAIASTKSDANDTIPAPGFAVWVPSEKNWLSNIPDVAGSAFHGQLTASLVHNDTVLLAGSLRSGGTLSPGAVELYATDNDAAKVGISHFPIDIVQQDESSGKKTKRAEASTPTKPLPQDGPLTAVFYNGNGKNLTVLGGHFVAKDSDGKYLHNLVIVDGSDDDKPTGLPSQALPANSTVRSVAVHKDVLFAGGEITGSIDDNDIEGVLAYDLKNGELSDQQPAALSGNVRVNTIAPQDKSSDVYVGGHFDSAGGMPCPAVCVYQMDQASWSRPGSGLDGTTNILRWANSSLIAAGDISVNDKKAYIAVYDPKKQTWTAAFMSDEGKSLVPGPVTSLHLAKKSGNDFWFAGYKDDDSREPYVMHYNGTALSSVKNLSRRSVITDIRMIGINNHGDDEQAVILTGRIDIPDFGTASAVVLEIGSKAMHPFLLATDANGEPATINGFYSEKSNTFEPSSGKHSRGIVVLVSFCIALGCVFLIVLAGIIASRLRRRQQGYVSAPQIMAERKRDIDRVPPPRLLDRVGGQPGSSPQGPGGAPMI
ncbi:hypothetical protein KEM52_003117 [Ascosphaera acerosa]|nr:hypothetical protein KEM52_003117 [Ascosphaera acerosa]